MGVRLTDDIRVTSLNAKPGTTILQQHPGVCGDHGGPERMGNQAIKFMNAHTLRAQIRYTETDRGWVDGQSPWRKEADFVRPNLPAHFRGQMKTQYRSFTRSIFVSLVSQPYRSRARRACVRCPGHQVP
jgi:hypothetical protein